MSGPGMQPGSSVTTRGIRRGRSLQTGRVSPDGPRSDRQVRAALGATATAGAVGLDRSRIVAPQRILDTVRIYLPTCQRPGPEHRRTTPNSESVSLPGRVAQQDPPPSLTDFRRRCGKNGLCRVPAYAEDGSDGPAGRDAAAFFGDTIPFIQSVPRNADSDSRLWARSYPPGRRARIGFRRRVPPRPGSASGVRADTMSVAAEGGIAWEEPARPWVIGL